MAFPYPFDPCIARETGLISQPRRNLERRRRKKSRALHPFDTRQPARDDSLEYLGATTPSSAPNAQHLKRPILQAGRARYLASSSVSSPINQSTLPEIQTLALALVLLLCTIVPRPPCLVWSVAYYTTYIPDCARMDDPFAFKATIVGGSVPSCSCVRAAYLM